MTRMTRVLALATMLSVPVTAIGVAVPSLAFAEDAPETVARVTDDEIDLRSGPGESYRVIYTAHRGETFSVVGRPGTDFWLRIVLPDGRYAFVPGASVQTFAVGSDEPEARVRPGFLAPPPLEGARGGMAIIGGVLMTPTLEGEAKPYGYLEIRPSLVVHKTISLDAFAGSAPTADGSQVLYGAGASVYFAPDWPICPFLTANGGGLSVFPNTDSFIVKNHFFYMGRVGGGVLFALRNRILIRLEADHLVLFTADSYRNAQVYAGGFGVYF